MGGFLGQALTNFLIVQQVVSVQVLHVNNLLLKPEHRTIGLLGLIDPVSPVKWGGGEISMVNWDGIHILHQESLI